MSQNTINILQLGFGPIGQTIVHMINKRQSANLLAIVDVDPNLQGQAIDQVEITADLSKALSAHRIDVAVVATTSNMGLLIQQITPLLQAGIAVVTTCEELAYPWQQSPTEAHQLDQMARDHHTVVLGTGVNPGFLMDYLPVVATGLCERVDRIIVERIQDTATRRIPFQKKMGVGLTVAEHQARIADNSIRHVGLPESLQLVAAKLGWELTEFSDTIEPVVDETNASEVIGTQQVAAGFIGDEEKIRLLFRASQNEPTPCDRIEVVGEPSFELRFSPPINGDIATAAIIVNAIPTVLQLAPGLRTMVDVTHLANWH